MAVVSTRMRVKRGSATDKARTKSLQKQLSEIAELHMAQAKLEQDIKEKEATLKKSMEANKITELEVDIAKAIIKSPIGRSTNVIDPRKFRDLCPSDDDFFACAKIAMTEAKKIVAERELKAITTNYPPQPKPAELKVKLKG